MRHFKQRLAEALDGAGDEYTNLDDRDKFKQLDWDVIRRACRNDGEAYIVYNTIRHIEHDRMVPQDSFERAYEDENYWGTDPEIMAARQDAADVLLNHFGIEVDA